MQNGSMTLYTSPGTCWSHDVRGRAQATFRVTGTPEKPLALAAHESPRTAKLYDQTADEITLDENASRLPGPLIPDPATPGHGEAKFFGPSNKNATIPSSSGATRACRAAIHLAAATIWLN